MARGATFRDAKSPRNWTNACITNHCVSGLQAVADQSFDLGQAETLVQLWKQLSDQDSGQICRVAKVLFGGKLSASTWKRS